MADVPVVEPAASGEGEANMPDRSVLDQVLSPDQPSAPVDSVAHDECPNCANSGKQTKLDGAFQCGECGFELPVYRRPNQEVK